MCTLHDFSVLKSNLFIRALLLDCIPVTEKNTRTPRVHLVNDCDRKGLLIVQIKKNNLFIKILLRYFCLDYFGGKTWPHLILYALVYKNPLFLVKIAITPLIITITHGGYFYIV